MARTYSTEAAGAHMSAQEGAEGGLDDTLQLEGGHLARARARVRVRARARARARVRARVRVGEGRAPRRARPRAAAWARRRPP